MVSRRGPRWIGLLINSSTPDWRAITFQSRDWCADRAMIGVWETGPCIWRIRRVVCSPSMSGISTSIRIKSAATPRRSMLSTVCPLLASTMVYPSDCRMRRATMRLLSLSSAMMTVPMLLSLAEAFRRIDGGGAACGLTKQTEIIPPSGNSVSLNRRSSSATPVMSCSQAGLAYTIRSSASNNAMPACVCASASMIWLFIGHLVDSVPSPLPKGK